MFSEISQDMCTTYPHILMEAKVLVFSREQHSGYHQQSGGRTGEGWVKRAVSGHRTALREDGFHGDVVW